MATSTSCTGKDDMDLTKIMESLHVSEDYQQNDTQIDQLAAALEGKLGVNLGPSAYRELALKMQQLTVDKEATSTGSWGRNSGKVNHNFSRRGRSPARPPQPPAQNNQEASRRRSPSPYYQNQQHQMMEEKKDVDAEVAAYSQCNQNRPPCSPKRPSSRNSSPFSRPGLQEDEDARERVGTRSPARSDTYTAYNIKQEIGLGAGQQRQPRRNSNPDNDDPLLQPNKPRSFSNSPMRRPGIDTSPGATSDVRGGRSTADPYINHQSNDTEGLEMPDFDLKRSGSGLPSMLTPPPRFASAPQHDSEPAFRLSPQRQPWMRAKGPETNLQPKASRLPDTSSAAFQPSDAQFTIGARGRPIRPTRGRPASAKPQTPQPPSSTSTTPAYPSSPFLPTPSQKAQGRADILSPMDVDTPQPNTSSTTPAKQFVNSNSASMSYSSSINNPVTTPHLFSMGSKSARKKYSRGVNHPNPPQASNDEAATQQPEEQTWRRQSNQQTSDSSKASSPNPNAEHIAAAREEGKRLYNSGHYMESIRTFSSALRYNSSHNDRAVLLSNRAAGLLMLGACRAAAEDCLTALRLVANGEQQPNTPFSSDTGYLLTIKLYTRMGRALLRLGEQQASEAAFTEATGVARKALMFTEQYHSPDVVRANTAIVQQMRHEASQAMGDAQLFGNIWQKISKCLAHTIQHPSDKNGLVETLGHVSRALELAPQSEKLAEAKVSLLGSLMRWREVAGYCERLAAWSVRWDSLFINDLKSQHPFPGIPMARSLTQDFFGELLQEDSVSAELKLSSRAAAEAVLRLPFVVCQHYIRALRLEERYPAATQCLQSLEELTVRGTSHYSPQSLQAQLSWIPKERSKLERTKAGRERGDELFRGQHFEEAAKQYGACLLIDGETTTQFNQVSMTGDDTAGGRLHAVLHCNRAACLMALRRFAEAIEDCSKALRIHTQYMKAMLRRARCFTRLQRHQEAMAEYKRYLELAEEYKSSSFGATSYIPPCLFDGPRDVTESDVAQVRKELDDAVKAKNRVDSNARQDADRRHNDRARWQDAFPGSHWNHQQQSTSGAANNGAGSTAQQRRDQFYSQQNSSRRWDSFNNKGPRSSHHRTNSWNASPSDGKPKQQQQQRSGSANRTRPSPFSPGSDLTKDHYHVLDVNPNATDDEIKKAFRKMALKYHPDKNKEENAADTFRRAKLAYETLNDPSKRQKYDLERRFNNLF